VFECQLNTTGLAKCRHALGQVIHHRHDQVLFVNLGPTEGRGDRVISALGRPYAAMDAPCIVVDGSERPQKSRLGRAQTDEDPLAPPRSRDVSRCCRSSPSCGDFLTAGDAVGLTRKGRSALIRAYEQRMDQLVTHPVFGYRISYRRVLEVQARLLARFLTGEIPRYPGFETR
jgi:hypothetical protein